MWVGTLTVGGDRDGREGGFHAVDNGPRPDAADQITFHFIPEPPSGSGFAADYCAGQGGARENPLQALLTLRLGSITIMTRP